MLMQFLPKAPERAMQADLHPGDVPEGIAAHVVPDDDAWAESQSLFGTIEDVELIDPDLSGERLLFRLFHERGVRVFPMQDVRAMLVFTRCGGRNACEFRAERPCRYGREWQSRCDL